MVLQIFSDDDSTCGDLLNLTPRTAFDEAKTGSAIIVDVREAYLTGYKRFDVPKVIYLPPRKLE